jgi:hypothetical protein
MSVRYHIVLPDQQLAALELVADRLGSSTASLVRLAIAEWLERRELGLPAAKQRDAKGLR